MAKKGAQQSFQFEINSDEDLFKYIDRKGLIVIDIYSDWCGPCIGMINNLKKIKLEVGGDNLHLAIAKSDTVDLLARFRNRSEPTWMFIANGKATNLLFGVNVPRLNEIIVKELEILGKAKLDRKYYAIDELQPIEIERMEAKLKAEQERKRIERDVEELKRKNYLNFCTNTILESLPEIGIMIFGSHITRDDLKKIIEVAEKEKLQPKDRKLIPLEQSDMFTLNYANPSPIDPKILEYMYGKEHLIVMWKLADGETRPIEEALFALRDTILKPSQDENNPDVVVPAMIQPLEIKVFAEPEEKPPESEEIVEEQAEVIVDVTKPAEETEGESAEVEGDAENAEEEKEDDAEKKEEDEVGAEEEKKVSEEEAAETPDESETVVEELKKEVSALPLKVILIPAAWTPPNKRTNAAGIYVFFRNQTVNFLPPDPIPEPPHLIAIYDAYKKREIKDLIAKWGEAVLSYGYFTSEDPAEAKLIANSTKNYESQNSKAPTDKIVVKISKKTSHCLLAFAKVNPTYVSENCEIGKTEANKFFPKNYKTGEQEEAEQAAAAKESAGGKRKSKKKEEAAANAEANKEGEPSPEA